MKFINDIRHEPHTHTQNSTDSAAIQLHTYIYNNAISVSAHATFVQGEMEIFMKCYVAICRLSVASSEHSAAKTVKFIASMFRNSSRHINSVCTCIFSIFNCPQLMQCLSNCALYHSIKEKERQPLSLFTQLKSQSRQILTALLLLKMFQLF